MTLRDELRAKISDLREQILDAKSRGKQDEADRLMLDLEVEKDSLQLLNEEQNDFDYLPQTGNPFTDYANAKRRT